MSPCPPTCAQPREASMPLALGASNIAASQHRRVERSLKMQRPLRGLERVRYRASVSCGSRDSGTQTTQTRSDAASLATTHIGKEHIRAKADFSLRVLTFANATGGEGL